jgi:methyl-accepting chemotaxis protein
LNIDSWSDIIFLSYGEEKERMNALKTIFSNTVFLTVISGVIVFILSQLFMELLIKPLARYNAIKAKIAYNLVYYANVYHNPIDLGATGDIQELPQKYNEASDNLRKLAAEIAGFAEERSMLSLFVKASRISEVQSSLIGLSNCCKGRNIDHLIELNEKGEEIIKSKLHLKSL